MTKPNKLEKSLIASFWDGVFASCMGGFTTDYITPYALVLKATIRQIGVLSALPNLAASLIQLKTADLTEKLKSRKKIINIFIFLHAMVGIPIIFLPRLFKQEVQVGFLILFVTLFTSFGAFAVPAWSSLMSDHVPYKSRGRFFGWRNRILGIVTVMCSLLAGLILHIFKNNILRGFCIIFTAAVICRFISWYFLTKMYEPRFKAKGDAYFSLLDFLRRVKESNFAKFVIFAALLIFCVNIASPFFPVFMLRDLKFNYLTYTLLVVTVTITQICTFDRWGMHADKIGNIKVIMLTSFFIASLPLWWVINRHPLFLTLAQVISGFAWAGFNLCATNFIYDAVTPQKRVRCIAFFNVFIGVATCGGALLGGYISNFMPGLFGYKLLSLFLLSSLLRFCIVFLFSGKIKEVRPTQKISSKDLFYSVIGIKPAFGITESSAPLKEEE
jgi:MFS family permease